MSKYQLLPPLSDDDYAALKADIVKRGVQVAVEYDQNGDIIDGFHRVKICKELEITDFPSITRTYPDDAARRTQARKLNLARRHLDAKTKRALIEAELQDNPGHSNRLVAKELAVSAPTVARVRRKAESTGTILQFEKRTGADGKTRKQRARLPRPSRAKEPDPHRKLIMEFTKTLSGRLRYLVPILNAEERKELLVEIQRAVLRYSNYIGDGRSWRRGLPSEPPR